MKNIDKIKITINSTLKNALRTIAEGAMKIAIVVDKKDKLIGTLQNAYLY